MNEQEKKEFLDKINSLPDFQGNIEYIKKFCIHMQFRYYQLKRSEKISDEYLRKNHKEIFEIIGDFQLEDKCETERVYNGIPSKVDESEVFDESEYLFFS